MKVEEALRQADALRSACQSDPGLWNLLQAEHDWALYGDACDPLSPAAPERALKALQRDIYLDVWQAALAATAPGSRVMVAGGGTGRFAQPLAQRGLRVELVDASPEAVRRAAKHLGDSIPVRVGDLGLPETLAVAAYDLVLAVEVACYATDPARIMQHLRAAVKPQGTLLYSVEARPGALMSDRDLSSPRSFRQIMDTGRITLPGLKHVNYYTRAEAAQLAAEAGLTVQDVQGVCYVPDGPFNGFIDATHLDDPEHLRELMAIERHCRDHALLRELPRAWAVTAVA
jgi:SAM-dependent methyltransferase